MTSGREHRVAVRDGHLRVRIDGPLRAPWVVFSNSLATDLTLWDPQVAAFALRYRMLRWDFRGHGGSAPAVHDVGAEMLADDLLAVMADAGVERACHVGTSMGALAGLAAAARAPQRFERLVLCGARLASSPVAAADLARRADLAVAEGMTALIEPTLAKWFGASSPAPALRARIAAMIGATDPASFAAYARGMGAYDLLPGLAALQVPILLMAGAGDAGIATAFAELAARDTRLACRVIDGAGHLPNIEAADATNRVLAEFVSHA
jgi:pimeloyl-ACP methyl ester carboxylesterase